MLIFSHNNCHNIHYIVVEDKSFPGKEQYSYSPGILNQWSTVRPGIRLNNSKLNLLLKNRIENRNV